MRVTWARAGLIAATLNVLVIIIMLATRQPTHERLAELDAFSRSGTTGDLSSAEPMYVAGRPFYSPAHTAGVPLAENVFFTANLPAMLGAYLVTDGVDELRYWFEAQPLSWTRRSWVMAVAFVMILAASWSFLVGSACYRFGRWFRSNYYWAVMEP